MAMYDFRCDKCGGEITQQRKMTEDAPAPMCGDCCVEMVRVYSVPGVKFKGAGFYSTDKNHR